MRHILKASATAALGAGLFALAVWAQDAPKTADYVAHEWGTFTSMQGSDGTTLDGLQHEEAGLPDFVYSRSKVRACPLRDKGYKGLECDVANVTEKMETPVIYFYAQSDTRVRVRVCMNHGLLTQWYPVCDRLGPPEGPRDGGPLDMSKVEKSFLEWDVRVLGRDAKPPAVPAVAADDPWSFARIPAVAPSEHIASTIETMPRTAPRVGPVEAEDFIFYRGLGRFTLPIKAETGDDAITIENGGDEAIGRAFVIEVKDGLSKFREVSGIAAHASQKVDRPPLATKMPSSIDAMVQGLLPQLESALVEAGLYPPEAVAMAKTWEKSYFRTDGLRVLYIVPRRYTDEVLPLAMEPAPRSLVRVLVGRLECITPQAEREAGQALIDWASDDPAMHAKGEARLLKFGRFLEPNVRYVLSQAKLPDEPWQVAGKEILDEILAGSWPKKE